LTEFYWIEGLRINTTELQHSYSSLVFIRVVKVRMMELDCDNCS